MDNWMLGVGICVAAIMSALIFEVAVWIKQQSFLEAVLFLLVLLVLAILVNIAYFKKAY